MNFNDIFKSGFLEKVADFSMLDTVIAMAFAFAIGLFIFFIYRKTFTGVMYSAGFALSLISMTVITTLIILAVTSNIILSLGMVGALSIVRFRTAVKEPSDISFIFWSICVGIVTGAGLIPLAVFGSLFIGVIMIVFMKKRTIDNPYVFVVSCRDEECETDVMQYIASNVKKSLIKAKTVTTEGIEVTVEVILKEASTKFVNEVGSMEGVSKSVLVSYNGDYMV